MTFVRSWSRGTVLLVGIAALVSGPAVRAQDAPATSDPGCGTLTLTDAGKDPRRLIRYQPTVGASVRVTTEAPATITTSGVTASPTETSSVFGGTWDLEVSEVDQYGAFRTDAVLVEAVSRTTQGVSTDTDLRVAENLERTVGMRGWWWRDPFGRVVEVGIVDDATRDPTTVAIFGESLRELTCRYPWFPDVAVGTDALWQIARVTSGNGIVGDLHRASKVWLDPALPPMTLNGTRLAAPVQVFINTIIDADPGPMNIAAQPDVDAELVWWRTIETLNTMTDLQGLHLQASGSSDASIEYDVSALGVTQHAVIDMHGRVLISTKPH